MLLSGDKASGGVLVGIETLSSALRARSPCMVCQSPPARLSEEKRLVAAVAAVMKTAAILGMRGDLFPRVSDYRDRFCVRVVCHENVLQTNRTDERTSRPVGNSRGKNC